MATSLYSEIEADLRCKGDYVLIDGTLETTGVYTPTGGISTPTLAGGVTISAPAVTVTKSLIISSKMTTHTGVTVGAPSGTLAGVVWTTGPPILTDGQLFVVLTCGSTAYRVPVWANA